jgi:hypothetical protein
MAAGIPESDWDSSQENFAVGVFQPTGLTPTMSQELAQVKRQIPDD